MNEHIENHDEDTPRVMVETASRYARERHARPVVADIREIEERMREADPGEAIEVLPEVLAQARPIFTSVLADHGRTYGEFASTAKMSQALKSEFAHGDKFGKLSDMQYEATDRIAGALAAILNGNPNHRQHWTDIAVAARLIEERLV